MHVVHCSGYSLAELKDGSEEVIDWRGRPLKGRFFDWDFVCVGTKHLLGRIPMTIRAARIFQAEAVIWSTGATFLGQVSEAEVMMKKACEVLADKSQVEWLRRVSLLEKESTDTRTSIRVARKIILKTIGEKPITVHFVTSDNHAPRVARDASIEFCDDLNITLSIVPAQTSYGKGHPSDVVIQEFI
jgi:hypothetical protein